jgi:hypothetical protein
MSKIEESLRELVREELKGKPPPPVPDRRQIIWLCLCVANVALLLWLLPETIFKDRAENLSKFVLWLGSSVFVSSFVWFREQLLGLTQKRPFKIGLLVIFPILMLIYVSQLNIFAIHPDIQPTDAQVIIEGQPVSDEDRQNLPLSLTTHWITVQPADWPQNDPNHYPRPRRFRLTRADVFWAWWGRKQPRWRLVCDVYVKVQGAVDEVVVRPAEIDRDFMLKPDPPLSPDRLAVPIGAPRVRGQELVYDWNQASDAQLPLRLPQGTYTIFSRKKNCPDGKSEIVEGAVGKNQTTELQEPCPETQ